MIQLPVPLCALDLKFRNEKTIPGLVLEKAMKSNHVEVIRFSNTPIGLSKLELSQIRFLGTRKKRKERVEIKHNLINQQT